MSKLARYLRSVLWCDEKTTIGDSIKSVTNSAHFPALFYVNSDDMCFYKYNYETIVYSLAVVINNTKKSPVHPALSP